MQHQVIWRPNLPLTATLLNAIKKRKYILEEPDLTYRTSQKGLTLLGVALLYEYEIFSINELHKYIDGASLTSTEDIKRLIKLTLDLPNPTENFIEHLKVFKILIYVVFTASFPIFL